MDLADRQMTVVHGSEGTSTRSEGLHINRLIGADRRVQDLQERRDSRRAFSMKNFYAIP